VAPESSKAVVHQAAWDADNGINADAKLLAVFGLTR
jgi:hypothetical protein